MSSVSIEKLIEKLELKNLTPDVNFSNMISATTK